MKKPWIILTLTTIALLGAHFALAATYTLTYDGYSAYMYYSPVAIPPGTYFYPCGANEGFSDGTNSFTSTAIGGGLWEITITTTTRTDFLDYFPHSGSVANCGTPINLTTTVAPYTPTLTFSVPVAGSTAPDFPTWKINAASMPSDGTLFRFDVVYSIFGGSTSYDDFNLANSNFSPEILTIPKTLALASGTTWTAQAFLYATSTTDPTLALTDPGDAIASTSIVTFTIGTPTIATTTPSSSPAIVSVCPSAPPIFQFTGSLPYFQINNPVPSIESGGCNIMLSAFEMTDAQSADINTRYNNAGAIIGVKPPLGYFTLITAALGSFASGSSTISLLPDATSTAALAPIFSPLDEGLAAAIGLLGAFWLLRRLKHIQP